MVRKFSEGSFIINTQLATGYDSSGDFKEAFSNIMEIAATKYNYPNIMKASWLYTPLGPMIAIANEEGLYLLEFIERRGLKNEIELLQQKTQASIISGITPPIRSIEKELCQYFKGLLTQFETPLFFHGTPFQRKVWEALMKIPFGRTCSYTDVAQAISHPTSYRAVARANGTNQLAIVIPCHRVINSDGSLSGYAGGVLKKKWLIEHEKNKKTNGI